MGTRTRSRFENLDEILRALDRIPARRIRTTPPPGTATEADWERLHEKSDRLYELVDATLVEKPMGAVESFLAGELIFRLRAFLQTGSLGAVFGADGASRLLPGLIRIPDVSFIRWERFPEPGKVPDVPVLDLAPDLAIEVISPGNRRREMQRKLREYFLAGVQRVWFIDPRTRSAQVYKTPDVHTEFATTDTLTDEDLLPGFALPLVQLFANLAEPEVATRKRRKTK